MNTALSHSETRISIATPTQRPHEHEQRYWRVARGLSISPEDMWLVLHDMRTKDHRYAPRSAAKTAIEDDVIRWSRAHAWNYGVRRDPRAIWPNVHDHVLYADSPVGQLSFHITAVRAAGLPAYNGEWDGRRGETWSRLHLLYGTRCPPARYYIDHAQPLDDERDTPGGWIDEWPRDGIAVVRHCWQSVRDIMDHEYCAPIFALTDHTEPGAWIPSDAMIFPDDAEYDAIYARYQAS